MSKNTRRRNRRKGIRDKTTKQRIHRSNRLYTLVQHWFTPSQNTLVMVRSIDLWRDLRDSLYSVPGSPFHGERSPVSKKFTVVLRKPLPIVQVKKLIEDLLIPEVLHVIKKQGENLDQHGNK